MRSCLELNSTKTGSKLPALYLFGFKCRKPTLDELNEHVLNSFEGVFRDEGENKLLNAKLER